MDDLTKNIVKLGLKAYIRNIILTEMLTIVTEEDVDNLMPRLNNKLKFQLKEVSQKIFNELITELLQKYEILKKK